MFGNETGTGFLFNKETWSSFAIPGKVLWVLAGTEMLAESPQITQWGILINFIWK